MKPIAAESAPLRIRPMQEADLPAVLDVQRAAYGDGYQESAAVLAAKLRLAPAGCWLAEFGGRVVGYVISHPWRAAPPPLHVVLPALPGDATVAFLHDLAIAPTGRGRGVAGRLLEHVGQWASAAGLRRIALVSLADARAFWLRHDFVVVADAAALPDGYGAGAQCMERAVAAGASA